jgi:hypothetical protein
MPSVLRYKKRMPEWRNWQTHRTQNPASVKTRESSTLSSGIPHSEDKTYSKPVFAC